MFSYPKTTVKVPPSVDVVFKEPLVVQDVEANEMFDLLRSESQLDFPAGEVDPVRHRPYRIAIGLSVKPAVDPLILFVQAM